MARKLSSAISVDGVLIAEELQLVLTDSVTGKTRMTWGSLDRGLAGAVIQELVLAGAVDARAARIGKRLVVRHPGPVGDAVLDEALARLQRCDGKRPAKGVTVVSEGLRRGLYDRMATRGMVRPQPNKVLGLFAVTRWPALDSGQKERTAANIHGVLVHGAAPDDRVRALIAMLWAVDQVTRVVNPQDAPINKRELRRRAKAIASGSWVAQAVHRLHERANSA